MLGEGWQRQHTCCVMGEEAESAEASAFCMSTSPGTTELADWFRSPMADVSPVWEPPEGCACKPDELGCPSADPV